MAALRLDQFYRLVYMRASPLLKGWMDTHEPLVRHTLRGALEGHSAQPDTRVLRSSPHNEVVQVPRPPAAKLGVSQEWASRAVKQALDDLRVSGLPFTVESTDTKAGPRNITFNLVLTLPNVPARWQVTYSNHTWGVVSGEPGFRKSTGYFNSSNGTQRTAADKLAHKLSKAVKSFQHAAAQRVAVRGVTGPEPIDPSQPVFNKLSPAVREAVRRMFFTSSHGGADVHPWVVIAPHYVNQQRQRPYAISVLVGQSPTNEAVKVIRYNGLELENPEPVEMPVAQLAALLPHASLASGNGVVKGSNDFRVLVALVRDYFPRDDAPKHETAVLKAMLLQFTNASKVKVSRGKGTSWGWYHVDFTPADTPEGWEYLHADLIRSFPYLTPAARNPSVSINSYDVYLTGPVLHAAREWLSKRANARKPKKNPRNATPATVMALVPAALTRVYRWDAADRDAHGEPSVLGQSGSDYLLDAIVDQVRVRFDADGAVTVFDSTDYATMQPIGHTTTNGRTPTQAATAIAQSVHDYF